MVIYSYVPKHEFEMIFYYPFLDDMKYCLMLTISILFILFFLYFIIVRKSIRTVMKGNDGIMVTRKFHLVAAKEGSS
jgi:hypothetical protein